MEDKVMKKGIEEERDLTDTGWWNKKNKKQLNEEEKERIQHFLMKVCIV